VPERSSIHIVEPLVVRRVVKRHRPVGFQIPHDHCYTLPTADLLAIVDRNEVPGELGEDWVALVAHHVDPHVVTRRRFHVEVHLAVRRRLEGESPDAVHERIDKLGRTEFDAVRAVLLEEDLLLPPYSDAAVWEEFVAQFLELLHFAPASLPGFFPTLRDLGPITALVRAEVDLGPIADRAGARPVVTLAPERTNASQVAPIWARSQTESLTFSTLADDAARRRNHVRAAILRTRARQDASDAIYELGCRLSVALPAGPAPAAWTAALQPLLGPAGSGYSPVEARLLVDLQRVAEASERESYELDPVGWALSAGATKLLRPLPGQRLVQGIRHLRTATGRLPSARIGAADAAALSKALRSAESCATQRGRAYFEPRIAAVLGQELPPPANLPEDVAQQTLAQRLVDRLLSRGFLTIGDLRDALSGSARKLPDLTLRDFLKGGPLLRTDRRLTRELDGAYRRGEIYMRLLLRLSGVFFGTPPGRVVTLFGTIPFGGAYVILSGLEHILNPALRWLGLGDIPFLTGPGVGVLGVYLLAMIHLKAARAASMWVVRNTGTALSTLLWRWPRRLYSTRLVQAFVRSTAGQLLGRFVVRPALPALALGWIAPATTAPASWSVGVAVALFLIFNGVLNSRFGRRLEDRVTVWAAVQLRFWRHHLVPGLIELVLAWSRRALDAMERVFYRVDEFLRYRSSDSRAAMVGKALLGLVWGAISYAIRIYVNLLIEPQINPIKHFPVVTVSHKIILPFTVQLTTLFSLPLRPFLGPVLASTVVGPTVVLLPGVFGFLVWELKENWRLYETNRPKALRPVIIGHHGESMLSLMKPGFHSGTLPRLYRQLRHAVATGNERNVRKRRAALLDVRHALETFLDREFIALLEASERVGQVHVRELVLGSNRVQISIEHAAHPGMLQLDFEEHAGWLLLRVTAGFLEHLDDAAAATAQLALDGVCRITGVDLLATDVEASLPAGASFDVTEQGLAVWPQGRWETEVVYDLRSRKTLLPVVVRGAYPMPALDASAVLVRHRPMRWSEWVDRWRDQASGKIDSVAR
jgi:hypothetical protein